MEFDHAAHLASIEDEAGRFLRETSIEIPDSLIIADLFELVDPDGNERTIEQIKQGNIEFFSRPEIVADTGRFNRAATIFAMQCQMHAHGQDIANSAELSGIHNHGTEQLGASPYGKLLDIDKDKESGKKKKKKDVAQNTGGLLFRRSNSANAGKFRILMPSKTNK